MNTRQLEYFVSLAETLNFTKTAQKFFISQTAVTKQIKILEYSLDTKLFNRNNHHVELTPAGNVFLAEAKAILQRIEEATERVRLTTIGFVGYIFSQSILFKRCCSSNTSICKTKISIF